MTATEVLSQFNDSETVAYDTAKGDDSSADITDIITKVVDQIRLAYANGGRMVDFQSASTIPDGEKNRAIEIIRWKYLVALPTGKSLAENRQPEAKKAEDYFLAVARREIKVAGGAVMARPGTRTNMSGFGRLGSS